MRYFAIVAGFALAVTGFLAFSAAQAADAIESDGKCWVNISNGNWAWADCPHAKASSHHKH
jgi:hypothetical protein